MAHIIWGGSSVYGTYIPCTELQYPHYVGFTPPSSKILASAFDINDDPRYNTHDLEYGSWMMVIHFPSPVTFSPLFEFYSSILDPFDPSDVVQIIWFLVINT